jgi:hypothetical protein
MKGLNYVGTVDEQGSCSSRGKKLQFNFVTLSYESDIKNPQHNTLRASEMDNLKANIPF